MVQGYEFHKPTPKWMDVHKGLGECIHFVQFIPLHPWVALAPRYLPYTASRFTRLRLSIRYIWHILSMF